MGVNSDTWHVLTVMLSNLRVRQRGPSLVEPNWSLIRLSFPVSPPSSFSLTHTLLFPIFPCFFWGHHSMQLVHQGNCHIVFIAFFFFWRTFNLWHMGNFNAALSPHRVAIFTFVQSGKRKRKGKDGCKHSWLLKGEIYSWVIKVYDWILSAIGCSEPRGTRSMNMNFMLLSILWSFPCISSRLSWGVETSFFFFFTLI